METGQGHMKQRPLLWAGPRHQTHHHGPEQRGSTTSRVRLCSERRRLRSDREILVPGGDCQVGDQAGEVGGWSRRPAASGQQILIEVLVVVPDLLLVLETADSNPSHIGTIVTDYPCWDVYLVRQDRTTFLTFSVGLQ